MHAYNVFFQPIMKVNWLKTKVVLDIEFKFRVGKTILFQI